MLGSDFDFQAALQTRDYTPLACVFNALDILENPSPCPPVDLHASVRAMLGWTKTMLPWHSELQRTVNRCKSWRRRSNKQLVCIELPFQCTFLSPLCDTQHEIFVDKEMCPTRMVLFPASQHTHTQTVKHSLKHMANRFSRSKEKTARIAKTKRTAKIIGSWREPLVPVTRTSGSRPTVGFWCHWNNILTRRWRLPDFF